MKQKNVNRTLALMVLSSGFVVVKLTGRAILDWAKGFMYSTSDIALSLILLAVLIGAFWWFIGWLFRGTAIPDLTRKEPHDATER